MSIFIIILASVGGLVLLTGLVVLCATIIPSIVVLFKSIRFTIAKNVDVHMEFVRAKCDNKKEQKLKKLLMEQTSTVINSNIPDPAHEIIE